MWEKQPTPGERFGSVESSGTGGSSRFRQWWRGRGKPQRGERVPTNDDADNDDAMLLL